MLTRQQIQRLAQRNGIGLHAQERDYLQHLILFELYNHTQEFIFRTHPRREHIVEAVLRSFHNR